MQRIIDTASVASEAGAFSITYHAAFYMGKDKETVYNQVKTQTRRIIEILENENINVWIRPETTGKATQWGDIDEIINLSKEFEQVLPCVDFHTCTQEQQVNITLMTNFQKFWKNGK